MNESAIWNELGNIYLKMGAFDEAIGAYQMVIGLGNATGGLYSNLASAFFHKGEYEEAIPLYESSLRLLKSNEEKAVVWNGLGDIYRRIHDYTMAMAAYQRAHDLTMDSDLPLQEIQQKDQHAAEPGISVMPVREITEPETNRTTELKIPSTYPSKPEPLTIQRGVDPMALNEPSPIREEFPSLETPRDTLDIEPSEEPENNFKEELIPSNLPVEDVDADPFLDEIKETTIRTPSVRIIHGEGDKKDEFESNRNDLSKSGKHSANNLEESVAFYQRMVDNIPANDGAWDALGNALRNLGRYEEAIAAFEQAVSLQPKKEEYWYHLGLTQAAQRHEKEAIEAFQRVVQLNPDYVLAHGALAGCYRRLGMKAEVFKHIQLALPLMQNEKEYNRACFEAICGNIEQAIEFLRVALVRKQTSLEWIRCDPDLDLIRSDPRFNALVDLVDSDSEINRSSLMSAPATIAQATAVK